MCGSGRTRAAPTLAPVRIATLRPRPSARPDRVEDYFLEQVNLCTASQRAATARPAARLWRRAAGSIGFKAGAVGSRA